MKLKQLVLASSLAISCMLLVEINTRTFCLAKISEAAAPPEAVVAMLSTKNSMLAPPKKSKKQYEENSNNAFFDSIPNNNYKNPGLLKSRGYHKGIRRCTNTAYNLHENSTTK